MNENINVTRPYIPDPDKFKNYVDQIFQSGMLTNGGPLVQELEQRLEHYLGVKNLLLVANGTLALQIAYKVLGLKGEVITTPFSFIATTSSLVWEGLTPVFADIDEHTLCINPQEIEKGITENTSAILPVHVYGNACDIDAIQSLAKKNTLPVIYDAAHAFAVNYKGQSVLNYGDISTLSFHATKLFHTIEGGALIIKDDELYRKAQRMINFGFEKGEIVDIGINAKMNEFEAAMGLCVLDDMQDILAKRKFIWETYKNNISEQLLKVNWNVDGEPNYSYYPILFSKEDKLLKSISQLKDVNIHPRRYFYPSLDQLHSIVKEGNCPISHALSKRVLCLPIYPGLEPEVIKTISGIVNSCEGN
ncbi:MAG: DegT/DnrJ/EryC1/StrS family aminotransferase [Leptospirales bacterium]